MVDPNTRTFRVIYETPNHDRLLAINQTVNARHGRTTQQTAVPSPPWSMTAVAPWCSSNWRARPSRAALSTGLVEGDYVQVAEGVKPGERIACAALLIRLSALSSQIPAHGHVH
jgi:hypothetical protein